MGRELLEKTFQLTSNASMPAVGLGTWKLKQPHLQPVLERAIELGCRHIDCAAIYENEHDVGGVLKGILKDKERFGVEREDVFN